MEKMICLGCDDVIEYEYMDFNGEDWHLSCFEVSNHPTYCCGMEYDHSVVACRSCGEPL